MQLLVYHPIKTRESVSERSIEFSFTAKLLSLYLETSALRSLSVPAKQLKKKNNQRSTIKISVKFSLRAHCLQNPLIHLTEKYNIIVLWITQSLIWTTTLILWNHRSDNEISSSYTITIYCISLFIFFIGFTMQDENLGLQIVCFKFLILPQLTMMTDQQLFLYYSKLMCAM